MHEDDQRRFSFEIFRREDVDRNDERIAGALSRRIFHPHRFAAGDEDLVDVRDVAGLEVPEDIVDVFDRLLEPAISRLVVAFERTRGGGRIALRECENGDEQREKRREQSAHWGMLH